MTTWHPYSEAINLHVEGRIEADDAQRQKRTAIEVLRRLADQPGLILADEVGMGKTFVALAVVTSVALSDPHRPVVVMVPPSLKEKWPRDFTLFAEKCLSPDVRPQVRAASADTAVQFLRLLDDPIHRRNSIIFLTHGAMHRGLTDGWVKLAIIQRALRGRHHTEALRRSLSRCLGKLLRLSWVDNRSDDLWEKLLKSPVPQWLRLLHNQHISPYGNEDPNDDDDPVPDAVVQVLEGFNTDSLYEELRRIPQRQSSTYDGRVAEARQALGEELKGVWRKCITTLPFKLPLLVMDEAHHLKNPGTQLSGLFQLPEARDDADEVAGGGAFAGVFERMLFLTATPFQLGHDELCSVLERFDGIAWNVPEAPSEGRDGFKCQVAELRERLDAAQHSALALEAAWGSLRTEDLVADSASYVDADSWWRVVPSAGTLSSAGERVRSAWQQTSQRMRAAETCLCPWVIRHLRKRDIEGRPRREKLAGRAIDSDQPVEDEQGLEVSGPALLPFLLAARAAVCALDSRPVFAEGLASSYEAFRDTRNAAERSTDSDDDPLSLSTNPDRIGEWYLMKLEETLPRHDHMSSASHPKVAATARRVLDAWRQGEKVLLFCHYVATGRVLRQVISEMMRDEILGQAAQKIGCERTDADARLESFGERFFDTDSPVRRACDAEVERLIASYPALQGERERLVTVVRRYLRTPSFLARYFPLGAEHLDESAVEDGFSARDASGMTLRDVLRGFFDFLETRCGEEERKGYLQAIERIQTGTIRGQDALASFEQDELQEASVERLLPNVRLVNGATRQETRQRLMLTFNSPFFPEVLIASSVMAEGVDLHRFCRYVIHHDLCWNPSTLEQRTGRIDRIGAKVEQCRQPIRLYLPYLAETQDEKMYRVVMDRERWFSVVMGESYKVDTRTTEKLAQRVPLPESLAKELAFRLEAAG